MNFLDIWLQVHIQLIFPEKDCFSINLAEAADKFVS